MSETSGVETLREFIENHVSSLIREAMDIEYVPKDAGPCAARFTAFGHRFRLEPDGPAWKLCSDHVDPKVLAEFEGDPDQFQRWLLLTIVDHTGSNGHKS